MSRSSYDIRLVIALRLRVNKMVIVRRNFFKILFVSLVVVFSFWIFWLPITSRLSFYRYIDFSHKNISGILVVCTKESDLFKENLNALGNDDDDNDDDEAYEILNDTSILPPSARIVPKKIFKDKPLVVWATEWHMTPIKDLKNLLSPFGVTFLDYNLDPWRCEWHDCKAKEKLKVRFVQLQLV